MRRFPEPPARASLYTHGCRLNQSETETLRSLLEAEGYAVVPFGEPADLGIVNTCSVTQLAESKCRQTMRQFTRRNPHGFLAVVGCYAQTGTQEVAAVSGVDLVVGHGDKLRVLDLARTSLEEPAEGPAVIRPRIARGTFTQPLPVGPLLPQRKSLKIQDGCDCACAFCLVPFARGRARSRAWQNLLDEAHTLARRGVREIVLTGVNLGTFEDDGRTLVDIVDALDAIPGVRRVRISSIEPTTVPLELIDRMASPAHRLVPYLHLPLQSGSDRILQRMRRQHTAADYREFVQQAMARCPHLGLGTDIMVGFPGEEEADFTATATLFRELPFAYGHIFPYSRRQGTLAARWEAEMIPVPARQRRANLLRSLSEEKQRAFRARHVGQVAEVLFEDPREESWPGLTGNYLRVIVRSEENLRNRRARVRLYEDPDLTPTNALSGEVLEVLDDPTEEEVGEESLSEAAR